ncbi:MAG: RadC family protein [Planctomycetota bacterium]
MEAAGRRDEGGGHRERLRDRFRRGGLDGFLDYEVLELALTHVIPRRDVKPLAKALLSRFAGVHKVLTARKEDLRLVPGVGEKTALFLSFLADLISRCLAESAGGSRVLDAPEAVVDFLRMTVGASREENFQVLFLNSRMELQAGEILQVGTVDQAVVYPRKVIERALSHNAVGLVLVHNHPSGNLQPSRQDVAMTARLSKAADAVDLHVHDHLIVTREGYFSFREGGLLKSAPDGRARAAQGGS